MGRRGPQPKGYTRVETTIPPEVDGAIDTLVAASGGISKATLMRHALLEGLAPYGLLSESMAATLTSTIYRERT
jgi:hypothetical protein